MYVYIYVYVYICCLKVVMKVNGFFWKDGVEIRLQQHQLNNWICQVLATRSMPMPCSTTSVQRTQPALAEPAGVLPALNRVHGSLMAPFEQCSRNNRG